MCECITIKAYYLCYYSRLIVKSIDLCRVRLDIIKNNNLKLIKSISISTNSIVIVQTNSKIVPWFKYL